MAVGVRNYMNMTIYPLLLVLLYIANVISLRSRLYNLNVNHGKSYFVYEITRLMYLEILSLCHNILKRYMRLLRIYIVIIFIFVTASHAIGQNMMPVKLPTQKQLPMAQIFRAFQDAEGYMWYGTEGGGLCRDDGYTIEKFRADYHTPYLLESNWITCITEDNRHRIWFGTKRGLYILDKKNYEVTPLKDPGIERWAIDAVQAASDGTIWVSAGNMMLHYDAQEERLGAYSIKWKGESKAVSQIYEDRFSNLWIVQWKGGIFKFDSEKNDFVPYPWPFIESPTYIIQRSSSDRYWVSTLGKGIISFDPNKRKVQEMFTVSFQQNDLSHSRRNVLGMLQDTIRNYLWTITSDNLYAYKVSERDELRLVETDFSYSEKKDINQIIGDKNGDIWVLSYYPHTFIISFVQDLPSRYVVPQFQKKLGRPVSPVSFVFDNGYYWFIQRHAGLYLCDSKNDDLFSVSQLSGLKGKKISPLIVKSKRDKGVFIVTNDTIVAFLENGNNGSLRTERMIGLPYYHKIHTLHEDLSSNLWIGTTNSLYCYNLQKRKLVNHVDSTGIINDIAVLCDGEVFLATEKKGLCLLFPDRSMRSYGKNENFSAITVSSDQTVWAGTQQGNVYYYDLHNDAIVSITKECSLNGDAVFDIEVDKSGYIWILTDQRIIVFNPANKAVNVIYNSDTSIQMNNFLSLYKTEDGNICVGGTGGFCSFPDYSGLKDAGKNIAVKLSSIKINEHLRLPGYAEEVIVLQPEERNLELFFSTFDHLNAKNIRYAFKYIGEAENWNYLPEGQNSIYLAGLAKGYYTLEVKATDKNGNWSDNSVMISIYCLPEWYESSLAFVIYVLLFIVVICIAVYYYLRRKKQKIINEQIQNSAQDLQELVCQLSGENLTSEITEELNIKALLMNMQKILQRQKEQREKTTGDVPSNAGLMSVSDEKFIQKALDFVEQNIDNQEYSVEQLSKDLGMERTGLYKKLISIIGKTPTSFIRSVRLKRAARFLEEGYTVAEAADHVGFGTSSYLSKCFQEEFGVKPSQYIASLKKRHDIKDN